MRIITIISLLMLSIASNAATISIDFESLDTGYTVGSSVSENGFSISTNEVNFLVLDTNGNQTLNMLASDEYFIASESGGAFDLLSLDTQEWHCCDYGDDNPTRVIGHYAGGGQIEVDLPVPASLAGLETYYFDSAWVNLDSIEIIAGGNNGFYLDNVVVSAVPVPAAVWLFGSALAGLGWVRRKQTA